MVDFLPIVKMVPLFVAAMVSPGPDFLLVSRTAMRRGRGAGVCAGLGVAVGVCLYAALGLYGLGVVFTRLQGLMDIVRVAGGLYLIYLGVMLWRGSFSVSSVESPVTPQRSAFMAGLLTTLTNPKTIAFFASVFALALPVNPDISTQVALLVFCGVAPALWFGLVSCFLSATRMRETYMRGRRWVDRVAGSCMAFFGARLLLSRN